MLQEPYPCKHTVLHFQIISPSPTQHLIFTLQKNCLALQHFKLILINFFFFWCVGTCLCTCGARHIRRSEVNLVCLSFGTITFVFFSGIKLVLWRFQTVCNTLWLLSSLHPISFPPSLSPLLPRGSLSTFKVLFVCFGGFLAFFFSVTLWF